MGRHEPAATIAGYGFGPLAKPVEKSGEDGQRDADRRGVARIVVVADCQSEVIECGHGAAVFGLKSCQKLRQG